MNYPDNVTGSEDYFYPADSPDRIDCDCETCGSEYTANVLGFDYDYDALAAACPICFAINPQRERNPEL